MTKVKIKSPPLNLNSNVIPGRQVNPFSASILILKLIMTLTNLRKKLEGKIDPEVIRAVLDGDILP